MSSYARVLVRLTVCAIGLASVGTDAESPLPSIVILLADDLGYGDVGYLHRGTNRAKTPFIDAMAAAPSAIQFNRFHSEISCTPSRHSILTGRSPVRDCCLGAPVGDLPISGPSTPSVISTLQAAGYQTLHVGKWQEALNTVQSPLKWPSALGYTTFDMYDHGGTYSMPCFCFSPTPAQCFRGHQPYGLFQGDSDGSEYLWGRPCLLGASPNATTHPFPSNEMESKHVADVAIDFITRADPDKPVYVHVAFRSVHVPYIASPQLRANCSSADPSSVCISGQTLTSKQLDYHGCIVAIDLAVGRVRDALRTYRKDWQNTIVVFASDNGPEIPSLDGAGSAGGLRGMKRSLFEGGIRVPMIFEWPARIKQNAVSNALVSLLDLPTTFEAIALGGASSTVYRDGESLLPLIDAVGSAWTRKRPVIVCSYVDNSHVAQGYICPQLAIIDTTGTWKLIVQRGKPRSAVHPGISPIGLYSLGDDNESHNMLSLQPKVAAELRALGWAWSTDVLGAFTKNCPGYYSTASPAPVSG